MADVTITRAASLTGDPLRNAVMAMITELTGRSPYSMLGVWAEWRGRDRIAIGDRGESHVSGFVDIQDGAPSRITANINLLSSLARGQRDRVVRDINTLADRHLAAGAAATTTAATAAERERERRRVSPERAAEVTTGVFSALTELGRQISEAFAPTTPAYAPPTYEPTAYAPPTPARPTTAPPAPPALRKPTPTPSELPGYVPEPTPRRVPWGWIALGGAVVVTAGVVAWAVTGEPEEEEKAA